MIRTITIAVLAAISTMSVHAVSIDFERLQHGTNSGAIYSDKGVTFSRGDIQGTVYAVGEKVQWTHAAHEIYGYRNWEPAWSGVTIGYAPGTQDLMITFDQAVRVMSLLSDRADPDSADAIRLLALGTQSDRDPWVISGAPESQQFTILGVAEGLDDGRSLLTNTYGFRNLNTRYFVFQSTTEMEGIDDLYFEAVPEPASMTVLGLGLAALVRRKRKAK